MLFNPHKNINLIKSFYHPSSLLKKLTHQHNNIFLFHFFYHPSSLLNKLIHQHNNIFLFHFFVILKISWINPLTSFNNQCKFIDCVVVLLILTLTEIKITVVKSPFDHVISSDKFDQFSFSDNLKFFFVCLQFEQSECFLCSFFQLMLTHITIY